jgi:plastocyanin
MRRAVAAIAVIGAIVALPAAAQAHKYTAYAGGAGRTPSTAPASTELNVFQPARMKIRAGDKVAYRNFAFHTVSVLGKGVAPPPLAVPVPGATYSGINDAQGNPFYFNGLTKFQYNPAVFGPVGNTTVGDGKTHSSGGFAPNGPSGPATYTLKFAKPGKYTVLCLLHPGMKQRVTVLKKKAKGADTDSQVKRRVLKESKKHYNDATKAAATTAPANTVYAGLERRNATLLAFAPQSLTVARGTTVSFVLDAPSEVHNMVFGPTDYGQQFGQQTSANGQVEPPFIYASQPTSGPGTWSYAGNEHGNGFFWSPLMDDQPGDPPNGLPGTEKITFTTPGTYSYFCAIHGTDMKGTIVVQ